MVVFLVSIFLNDYLFYDVDVKYEVILKDNITSLSEIDDMDVYIAHYGYYKYKSDDEEFLDNIPHYFFIDPEISDVDDINDAYSLYINYDGDINMRFPDADVYELSGGFSHSKNKVLIFIGIIIFFLFSILSIILNILNKQNDIFIMLLNGYSKSRILKEIIIPFSKFIIICLVLIIILISGLISNPISSNTLIIIMVNILIVLLCELSLFYFVDIFYEFIIKYSSTGLLKQRVDYKYLKIATTILLLFFTTLMAFITPELVLALDSDYYNIKDINYISENINNNIYVVDETSYSASEELFTIENKLNADIFNYQPDSYNNILYVDTNYLDIYYPNEDMQVNMFYTFNNKSCNQLLKRNVIYSLDECVKTNKNFDFDYVNVINNVVSSNMYINTSNINEANEILDINNIDSSYFKYFSSVSDFVEDKKEESVISIIQSIFMSFIIISLYIFIIISYISINFYIDRYEITISVLNGNNIFKRYKNIFLNLILDITIFIIISLLLSYQIYYIFINVIIIILVSGYTLYIKQKKFFKQDIKEVLSNHD